MTPKTRPRPSLRFRGRSFVALVLTPELPIEEWLGDLDGLLKRSPGFFRDRAIVIDVAALGPGKPDIDEVIAGLHQRGIRIMGIEGADPGELGLGLPPAIAGGRPAGDIALPESGPDGVPPARAPAPLVVDTPVRSGQSIIHPDGDVIVVGAVSSGAEIIAGGSIHIYGALRGRAVAGSMGNAQARIFCRKLEAELLAIDGLYHTAEDVEPQLRGRPVQVWLTGDTMMFSALD